MPSTLVHISIAALISAGLLRDFDRTVLLVAVLAVVIPDIDTFLGLIWDGAHRSALHTAVIPILAAAAIGYDQYIRESSWLERVHPRGLQLASLGVIVYLFAGIAPDLMTNGVNLFYPVHDRFYAISGEVFLSTERGLVQTLWDPVESVVGTTESTQYQTGITVEPGSSGETERPVDRVFPIAHSGLQVLLIGLAVLVTSWRLWKSPK